MAATAFRDRLFRGTSAALLVPQIFIYADGWHQTRSLWPQGDVHNRILADLLTVVGATERLIPSLRASRNGCQTAACVTAIIVINIGQPR
jgi:hypothetical protein